MTIDNDHTCEYSYLTQHFIVEEPLGAIALVVTDIGTGVVRAMERSVGHLYAF